MTNSEQPLTVVTTVCPVFFSWRTIFAVSRLNVLSLTFFRASTFSCGTTDTAHANRMTRIPIVVARLDTDFIMRPTLYCPRLILKVPHPPPLETSSASRAYHHPHASDRLQPRSFG